MDNLLYSDRNNFSECHYGQEVTEIFENTNSITFDYVMGSVSNPIMVNIPGTEVSILILMVIISNQCFSVLTNYYR